jgi:hypothetical protein
LRSSSSFSSASSSVNAEFERNQLRDAVGEAVAQTLHAGHVAHHGFGCHRAVRDDLRDALAAITLGDVVDDAIAAFHAEVDVEVRHRDALGIQEALEQQVVAQRIQVGDAERIGDQRSGPEPRPGPTGTPFSRAQR